MYKIFTNIFLLIALINYDATALVISKPNVNKEIVAKFDQLLNSTEFNKQTKLLLVLYGFNNFSKKSLFNPEYGLIINKYKKYKFPEVTKSNLEKFASFKLDQLTNKLYNLHIKYKILSKEDDKLISNIKNKKINTSQSLYYLYKLTKITRHLPIYLPIYSPTITSHFGIRNHPIKKKNIMHKGIDLTDKKIKLIFAAGDGVVSHVYRLNGYGNTVVIKHNNIISTKYAHLSHISVKPGQKVIRGEKIGIEGKTGSVTAEHLHFEIIANNKAVNPYNFIF